MEDNAKNASSYQVDQEILEGKQVCDVIMHLKSEIANRYVVILFILFMYGAVCSAYFLPTIRI